VKASGEGAQGTAKKHSSPQHKRWTKPSQERTQRTGNVSLFGRLAEVSEVKANLRRGERQTRSKVDGHEGSVGPQFATRRTSILLKGETFDRLMRNSKIGQKALRKT